MCCRGSAARHRGPRSPRRRSLRHLRAGGRWQRAACRCSGSAFCAPTPAEVRYAVRQRPPDAAKHPVERSTSCPSRPWRAERATVPNSAQSSFRLSRRGPIWAPRRCVEGAISSLRFSVSLSPPVQPINNRTRSPRQLPPDARLARGSQHGSSGLHGDRGQILRGPKVQSTRRARPPTEARRAELGVAARPRARPR